MLNSPISVTIGATPYSLSRINTDNFASTYLAKAASKEIRMTIRHSYEKANVDGQYERHNVDLVETTFDANGKPSSIQAYVVFRAPRGGTSVPLENVVKALNAFTTAQAAALVAWES